MSTLYLHDNNGTTTIVYRYMFIPADASVRPSFTGTGDMEFRYSAGSINSNIHVNCAHVIVTVDNHYIHAPRNILMATVLAYIY